MHMIGQMGRAISKGNETKAKMKHPSDMPTDDMYIIKEYKFELYNSTFMLPYFVR